jgi:hypothetical protein
MLSKNSAILMDRVKSSDVVLDIGAWAHPFNRANYVIDCEPYETRGHYNHTFAKHDPIPPIGGGTEYFNKESWVQRDICDKAPFPFRDKEIDLVICSHTLEDIRDPLWVCAEMVRIGKAGYIEVPSRISETCRGYEPGIAGLSHHRWLIDITGHHIQFLQKYHRIHNWRYSLPRAVQRRLSEEDKVQWLFWENTFEYAELVLHGEAQVEELERFVRSAHAYPRPLLAADTLRARATSLAQRATDKARRILRVA